MPIRVTGGRIMITHYKVESPFILGNRPKIIKRSFPKSQPQSSGWFETEEGALEHFKTLLPEASRKLYAMKEAIDLLKKEHGCDIGFTMNGDTHGIYESHLDIITCVQRHDFVMIIDD
jgi:hypothetical protein